MSFENEVKDFLYDFININNLTAFIDKRIKNTILRKLHVNYLAF